MKRRLLVSTVALLALLGLASCSKQDSAARPELQGGARQEQINRGRYLAAAGDCYACHTVRGSPNYAGGLAMPTPFGKLYTPNITPDPDTGIGRWTADDFWAAMHDGKSKDGSYLYPAMPFTNYTLVTREDSDAIYAYMMSVPPVKLKSRPHEMRFPYNRRELLAGWRALYFKEGVYQDDPTKSKEWNRGAYLVEGLGHCDACHSARNLLGAVSGDDVSGGLIPLQNWYAPSLASSQSGLGDWEVNDIVDLLRTGVAKRGAVFGPMAAVVQHSLQKMSVADLTAMATYLKAPTETLESKPLPRSGPPEALAEAMMKTGAQVYKDRCEACHQPDGEGVPYIYPPLANNQALTMHNPVNAIRIVLNGGFPPSTEGNPRPYGMPPFYQELSDEQVAAVVTYIRRSWGNQSPPTWPIEVERSRGVPAD